MSVFDKFMDGVNKFVNVTDKDPSSDYGDPEVEVPAEPEYEAPVREVRPRSEKKIVSIGSRTAPAPAVSYADSQMMVRKASTLHDAADIVNLLKRGHIIVVNLEECTDPVISQRIIDILCGACYALESTFKMVAVDTYILSPKGIIISDDSSAGNDSED